jgi:hypothetical protein
MDTVHNADLHDADAARIAARSRRTSARNFRPIASTQLKMVVAVNAPVVALSALIAGDAMTAGREHAPAHAPKAVSAAWTEVKWPFPLDQWGIGRAFHCRAADCGTEIKLYLRAKLGFCDCTTGVADDPELDRIGDLELLSDEFEGLGEGRPIAVAWMTGRSRPYRVAIPHAAPRTALAIAFNDKCDVVVATVISEQAAAAEPAALSFLDSDLVRRWVEKELGL